MGGLLAGGEGAAGAGAGAAAAGQGAAMGAGTSAGMASATSAAASSSLAQGASSIMEWLSQLFSSPKSSVGQGMQQAGQNWMSSDGTQPQSMQSMGNDWLQTGSTTPQGSTLQPEGQAWLQADAGKGGLLDWLKQQSKKKEDTTPRAPWIHVPGASTQVSITPWDAFLNAFIQAMAQSQRK